MTRLDVLGEFLSEAKGMGVALFTAGHPDEPSPLTVRNTFREDEMREAVMDRRVDLIVHHGRHHRVPGFLHVGSHKEMGVIFANRESRIHEVSVPQLIRLLTGFDGDHAISVPDGNVWRLFCHGGAVNLRILGAALGQSNFSIPRGARYVETFHTYEELANETCKLPGAIVAGLRGESALSAGLQVLRVNGHSPLEEADRKMYPLQYTVHVYVRRLNDGRDWMWNDYVERIDRRMSVDEIVLAALAERRTKSGSERNREVWDHAFGPVKSSQVTQSPGFASQIQGTQY